jgi:hypothetical protein
MNLNDPFGRLAVRHQNGYETMRDTMRRGGINTPEEALEVIRQSKKRAWKFIAAGLAVFLPMSWLLPGAMPVTLSLALFLVAWVSKSAINGQRYIQRYIDEDLQQGKQDNGRSVK